MLGENVKMQEPGIIIFHFSWVCFHNEEILQKMRSLCSWFSVKGGNNQGKENQEVMW